MWPALKRKQENAYWSTRKRILIRSQGSAPRASCMPWRTPFYQSPRITSHSWAVWALMGYPPTQDAFLDIQLFTISKQSRFWLLLLSLMLRNHNTTHPSLHIYIYISLSRWPTFTTRPNFTSNLGSLFDMLSLGRCPRRPDFTPYPAALRFVQFSPPFASQNLPSYYSPSVLLAR